MIKQAITSYMFAIHRPWDRSQSVGASEVGSCARRVWFSKFQDSTRLARDSDRPDRSGARHRGDLIEKNLWLPALRHTYGSRLIWAGDEQHTFGEGQLLTATPDGLLIDMPNDALKEFGIPSLIADDFSSDRSIVVDCKSVDPRILIDGVKFEHRMQVVVQIGLIRQETNYRPRVGLLSYIDASWHDEVEEHVVIFDQQIFEHAQRRAAMIMSTPSVDVLRPEGWIDNKGECEHCPWSNACARVRSAVPETPDNALSPEQTAALITLGREYKLARQQADSAEQSAREMQVALKDQMRAHDATRVSADGVAITWSRVKGRRSTDIKALREAAEGAGIDTAAFERTGEGTDRLVVTMKAEETQ
jgi:hypothetical protein